MLSCVECTVCGKRFTLSYDLWLGTAEFAEAINHTTFVCGKVFSRSGGLSTHIRVHMGEKLHKCHMCDIAFSQSGNLSRHMTVHTGEKPHKCSLCDRSFRTFSNLQQHESHTHSNRKPYHCLRRSMNWSFTFFCTLEQSRTPVDIVRSVLQGLVDSRHT